VEAKDAGGGKSSMQTQAGRANTGENSRHGMPADPRAAERDRPSIGEIDVRVTSFDLPGLGVIDCMAVTTDGTLVVCTITALYTVSRGGLKTLLAGHTTRAGFTDGKGGAARFDGPGGIVVDSAGNVLMSDRNNHSLRKVTRTGAVSTLAGNGTRGYQDGVGDAARFNRPLGIAVDADGTIYVADCGNSCVRQVAPDDGAVSTLAGDGKKGTGFADGLGLTARFYGPTALALDTHGNLLVSDSENDSIRRVTTAEGRVTTVAGRRQSSRGFADGEGVVARFYSPIGIAVDGNNNIFVADTLNNRIRMIVGAAARVTTVVGSGQPGKVNGTSSTARFNEPWALAFDERGRLLVADNNQSCVRVLEASLLPPRQIPAVRVLLLQVRACSPRTQWCACCR